MMISMLGPIACKTYLNMDVDKIGKRVLEEVLRLMVSEEQEDSYGSSFDHDLGGGWLSHENPAGPLPSNAE